MKISDRYVEHKDFSRAGKDYNHYSLAYGCPCPVFKGHCPATF